MTPLWYRLNPDSLVGSTRKASSAPPAKNVAISKTIEWGGWPMGIAAAAAADHFALSVLTDVPGGKRFAVVVSLVLGVGVMFLFVEVSRRLASAAYMKAGSAEERDGIRRRRLPKTPAERLPMASRILILVVVALIAAAMTFNGLPISILFK